MTTLTPGANAALSSTMVTATIKYSPIPGADMDVSAFLLDSNGKVRGDGDMCFYGQTAIARSAVQLVSATPEQTTFSLNLSMIDAAVERIALTATIHENRARFANCSRLEVSLSSGISAPINTGSMQETALILGEFYRRNGDWKFRCVAQGFVGGLGPLASHFGVQIIAPTPAPDPTPAPAPVPHPSGSRINLDKISLDKRNSSISLEKRDSEFGEIKVNLNWNRGNKGGFMGFGKANAVDLDLGCLFELKDGTIGAVQALGDCFGSYRDMPYIQLMGDDRTGANAEGEWLRINGNHWREIKRIIIFTYIYGGAHSWHATDGVVTLYAPDQPPVEVRLNEEGGQLGMCAIAMLENINGSVRINREVRFFKGHEELDRGYGWGLRWRAGSK